MRLWKVLGVAGVAGVAATGAVIARVERRRHAYEPDAVRERLHQRHAEAVQAAADAKAAAEAEAERLAEQADRPDEGSRRWLMRPWGRRRR